MSGLPVVVLIPLGRLQLFPIPLLARGTYLFFTYPIRESESCHGRPIRRTQEADQVQEADQAREANQRRKPRERSIPVPVPDSAKTLNIINGPIVS